MTRLRLRRRSLAIAGAACLAAAALVAVSMPASAESEASSIVVSGDYLTHESAMLICAGAVQDSAGDVLVA